MRRAGRSAVVVAALAVSAALAGCSAAPSGGVSPAQSAWTVRPTAAPSGGTSTGGAAAEKKAQFDRAVESVLSTDPKATGQKVAAALEAAGFARSSVQFSASRTSADLAPGSVIVAAQVGSTCLIGQWGPAVGGYHSVVAPALGAGGCLVGAGTSVPSSTSGGQLGD